MENVERFANLDFVATSDDVLRCRVGRAGIQEVEFDSEGIHFRRSERKKWAHCFEDVTAIIFVVAMDEYDMTLYGDSNVNRIQEARKLFDDVVNSRWFQNTAVILFLNNCDKFKVKCQKVDLKVCFSDYKGGFDYENAAQFMRHKFKKLNRRSGRKVYANVTCSTDTENMRFALNSVKDVLLPIRSYDLRF